MKSVCKALLLSAALLVLSGCTSIVGSWKLESITPEEGAKHFDVARMTLRKDGTYCALAKKEGKDVTYTGKYTFENNKLGVTTSDDKTRTYDAKLMELGSKLEVKSTVDDKEVTAIMKRGKCCDDRRGKCDKCGGCCMCGKCGKCPRCGKCTCGKPA